MRLKKSVQLLTIILFFLILSITITFAQDQLSEGVDKAYSCLESQLGVNCGSTTNTAQNAFNLLAIAYDSDLQNDCKQSLNQKKQNTCWGTTETGDCNIKSTALATLALQNIGDNIDDQITWILENKKLDTELIWYLEIDANNKTTCDVNGNSIIIEENKKITGNDPEGLTKAYSDYWFRVNDIDKDYVISCDRNFITALIYQKPGSNVFHVTSDSKSGSEFDSVTERVNAFCLTTSTRCDYEGTLWATLALAKAGEDISPLIPYLISFSDNTENFNFLPSAFLYILTNSDDYYSELINLQLSNSYWDVSRNRFFDTALALLSLQSVISNEIDNSKKYLLNNQKDSGCWQSDTAFILHSVWPRLPILTGGGGGVGLTYCEDFGNFCIPSGECDLSNSLDNFYCASSAHICCQSDFQDSTCIEKGGIICSLDQECSGNSITSFDSNYCCVGDCVVISGQSECEQLGFSCKESCSNSQEEKTGYSNSCNLGDICCGTKTQTSGNNIWIIIILIILIILVIIGIVFRKRIRLSFSKIRSSKSRKQPPVSTPPRGTFAPIKRMIQPKLRPSTSSTKDKEFEETMKKLKEMSK